MLKDLFFFVLFLVFGVSALFQVTAIVFLANDLRALGDFSFAYREPVIVFLTINSLACIYAAAKASQQSVTFLSTEAFR